ncbi:FK506-binding protein-like [Littorina saxatilis]|uniref:BDBT FKBP like N-terminal domain-containing protein n=1 Tax=Littorina saxatilis TaxID=31220 RepID=A0AAN9AWR6_9CAEN
METSDIEGDGATMDVDAGMVSMDTNDEDDGIDDQIGSSMADSTDMDADAKDFQDFHAVPQPPGPTSEHASGKVWNLPEGSCRKKVLQRGEGLYGPVIGSCCTVTIQVTRPVGDLDLSWIGYPVGQGSFQVGEATTPVAYLLDQALTSMKKSEIAEVCVSGLKTVSGELLLQVTLHTFTPATPPWRMTPLEKCTSAKACKERGAQLFKEGNIYAAFAQFRSATRLLLSVLPLTFEDDETMEASHQQLLCQCYLNLAACQMKTGHNQEVATNCTKALYIDPTNVKALYRRASASVSMGNYLLAQGDLEKGLRKEPNNRALAELLQTVNVQVSQSQAQLVQGLSKMFS